MSPKKPVGESREGELFTDTEGKRGGQSRYKIQSSIPGEAKPVFEAMRRRLKMTMAEFINSAIAYACWSEKEHTMTGEAVREGGEAEEKMWAEIVRDFGKQGKTGSFFQHALDREMQRLLDEAAAVLAAKREKENL